MLRSIWGATTRSVTSKGDRPTAIAASVSLESIARLLSQFGDVEPAIDLTDVCLKATAAALRGTSALPDAVIRFGDRPMAGLARLTLGAIAALRNEGGTEDGQADGPVLVLSRIDRAGLRPVAMPVPQGAAARLVVAGTADSDRADCLFSYDPTLIDDTAAADLLLAFKDAMEIPLRLIV